MIPKIRKLGRCHGQAAKQDCRIFRLYALGQYFIQVVDTTFGPYADMTITKDGEIVLGYIKQDRACIESVLRPARKAEQ